MGAFPQSFEVYGFTIEVHAGGRRVWPPSFKRFVKEKLDDGKLTVTDVTKECNVSKSLVYKWRADVKASLVRTTTVTEEAFFSEVMVQKDEQTETPVGSVNKILLRGREVEISLPSAYPDNDLVRIILSLELRA